MPRVTFIEPDGTRHDIDAKVGLTLMEIGRGHGLDIEGACEGSLACSTCHVVVAPDWYERLRAEFAPLTGSPEAVSAVAREAGLDVVGAEDVEVDVGVHTAEDLVRYRFGQAQYAPWFAAMPPRRAAEVRAAALAAVAP